MKTFFVLVTDVEELEKHNLGGELVLCVSAVKPSAQRKAKEEDRKREQRKMEKGRFEDEGDSQVLPPGSQSASSRKRVHGRAFLPSLGPHT